MGETRKAIFSSSQPGLGALIDEAAPLTVETPGGRIQIQWDYEAKATPNGQLAFFAEFLKTSGVYREWDHQFHDLSVGRTRYVEHRVPTVLRGHVDGRVAHQLLLHFERQAEFRQACPIGMPATPNSA